MMNTHHILNGLLIFAGAIILLMSLLKIKNFRSIMPYIPDRQLKSVKRYLILNRGLMIFFLNGYIVVLTASAFHIPRISEVLVSLIFFLGALFVFHSILLQSRLLSEVQNTLQGILTVCLKCKKVRIPGGYAKDPDAWMEIEKYISTKADAKFSHGLCPTCYEEEMKNIDNMLNE